MSSRLEARFGCAFDRYLLYASNRRQECQGEENNVQNRSQLYAWFRRIIFVAENMCTPGKSNNLQHEQFDQPAFTKRRTYHSIWTIYKLLCPPEGSISPSARSHPPLNITVTHPRNNDRRSPTTWRLCRMKRRYSIPICRKLIVYLRRQHRGFSAVPLPRRSQQERVHDTRRSYCALVPSTEHTCQWQTEGGTRRCGRVAAR